MERTTSRKVARSLIALIADAAILIGCTTLSALMAVTARANVPALPDPGLFGLIDREGELIAKPIYDRINNFSSNGLAIVALNRKAGYMNTRGQIVLPLEFDDAHDFSANGLAAVCVKDKWGYIDPSGRIVIEAQFGSRGYGCLTPQTPPGAYDFTADGMATAQKDGKWGYIDTHGKWIVEPQFDSAFPFKFGYARVRLNGDWGYIDSRGQLVIPNKFESAGDFAGNGLAAIKVDDQWGYIDRRGHMAISPQFELAWAFGTDAPKSLAKVCTKDDCGFIDAVGKFHLKLPRATYSVFYIARQDYITMQDAENGKWGLMDEAGKIAIKPIFQSPLIFSADGVAHVQADSLWVYINTKGQFITQPTKSQYDGFPKNGQLTPSAVNGKIGFEDFSGNMVVKPQFDAAEEFNEFGVARVNVKRVEHAE